MPATLLVLLVVVPLLLVLLVLLVVVPLLLVLLVLLVVVPLLLVLLVLLVVVPLLLVLLVLLVVVPLLLVLLAVVPLLPPELVPVSEERAVPVVVPDVESEPPPPPQAEISKVAMMALTLSSSLEVFMAVVPELSTVPMLVTRGIQIKCRAVATGL